MVNKLMNIILDKNRYYEHAHNTFALRTFETEIVNDEKQNLSC